MIIKSVEFITSSADKAQFPISTIPEIAFAGRSNVGKSSLINALLNRRQLAHVSSKPGKTQTINFFLINKLFHLVDLPGYGYAAVAKAKKEGWGPLIESYLAGRDSLKLVLHLVDSRHEPSKLDIQMHELLVYYSQTNLVVATKRDKIARAQWQKSAAMIQSTLGLPDKPILFSIKDSLCVQELWQQIAEVTELQ